MRQDVCLDDAQAEKSKIFGQGEFELYVARFSFELERRTGTRDVEKAPEVA